MFIDIAIITFYFLKKRVCSSHATHLNLGDVRASKVQSCIGCIGPGLGPVAFQLNVDHIKNIQAKPYKIAN